MHRIAEGVLKKIREDDKRKGLVHNENKKTPWVNVPNIVEAARDNSFAKYIAQHNLPGPNPPHCNDWTLNHDCAYLRTHGYLVKKGFQTLLTYIGIAQLADYLDRLPNRDEEVDWRKLTITEARLAFKQLCRDIGIQPRAMGPFITTIARATVGQRSDPRLFGGRKLQAPPAWCVSGAGWKAMLMVLRSGHYTAQARRQGHLRLEESEELPMYGERTPQQRAPRRKRKEPESSESSSEQQPPRIVLEAFDSKTNDRIVVSDSD